MPVPLPEDVRRLILAHLPTMAHVDVLLALARAPAPMTASDIARRTFLARESALAYLVDLVQAQLVATRHDGPDPAFEVAPANPQDGMAIDRLAEWSTARPVSLVRFVYERSDVGLLE